MDKTILWRSPERQLQLLTHSIPSSDLFKRFCEDHRGQPVVLLLQDGQQVAVILVDHKNRLLCVKRPPFEDWMLVSDREVVGVATS